MGFTTKATKGTKKAAANLMSGLAANVFLRQPFQASDSGRVSELLNNLFDRVEDTRKGRHWEFTRGGCAGSLSVHPTAGRLVEYEEQILELGRLPTELPEVFVVLFGCSSESDHRACELLVEGLTREFDGIVDYTT